MTWVNGILLPIIKTTLYGGFLGFFLWKLGKGLYNAWTKSWKFIWKYKIKKKEYPEKTMTWIFSCVDKKIGWHDAKKLMMVGMTPRPMMNETLWIYKQTIFELNEDKGGVKNGRQFKRSNSKKVVSEFPTI